MNTNTRTDFHQIDGKVIMSIYRHSPPLFVAVDITREVKQMDHMSMDGLDKYRDYQPPGANDLWITRSETYQVLTVHAPERDELDERDAMEFALAQLGDDAVNWTFVDCERLNSGKVIVRLQAL